MTRGVDLRCARTLDEVRTRLAEERRRCGPDTWVLGHSVRYEPFHDSGIRADAIAEAVGDAPGADRLLRRPHRARHAARARAGGRHGRARVQRVRRGRVSTPTAARPARCWRTPRWTSCASVVPAWTEAERLDAFAATLRALNRVGLTGAHVMLGDPELLDGVPRAGGARRPDRCGCVMPMHQEPAITDEEVERRLAARRRARTALARRHRQVLPRRRARLGHRVAGRPRPGRRERACRSGRASSATPSSSRASPRAGLQRDHPRRRRRRGPRRARRLRGRRAARARQAPGRAHRDADRRGPPALRRARRRRLDAAAAHGGPRRPEHAERVGRRALRGPLRARLPHARPRRQSARSLPLGSDWMVADFDPRVGHGLGAAAAHAGRTRASAVPARRRR